MPRGGYRPGSGPKKGKPQKPQSRAIIPARPEAKPRGQFMGRMPPPDGRPPLTPIDVLQDNMEFYFEEAGNLIATIMLMDKPKTRTEAVDRQFDALKLLTDHFRMRDKAGDAAAQLARFVHRSLAPKPYSPAEDAPAPELNGPPVIRVIPTPPGVKEAVRRVAEGLPPEPRKTL